jgi:arylsulfatase A-like enzyme
MGETNHVARRDFLRTAGLLTGGALAAAATSCAGTGKRRPTPPPNILWITCEDMSPNLGCYGDAYARTPAIDALARQSVRYTRAFATAPVCSPVRSCLITGVYATSLGTQNLRSSFPVPAYMQGFPSYLRAAGYFCTNNVKTDYNTANEPAIKRASWDQCSTTAHWRNREPGQPFFAVFNDMTTHQSRSMVWPYEKFRSDVQKELAPEERHDPAAAPVPPYYPDTPVVRRTVARYYDCISVMDKHVARRLKELEEDGLADDTVVFFYSDHGAGLPRHKRVLLDSGLHVPLLVRFPEKYRHLAPAAPGATVDRLVSFVDFPPTVLSLLGLPVPAYMQGTPFLGPEAGDEKPREYVFGARDRVDEAFDCARCVRDENYLYIRTFMPHISYNQPSFYSDQGEIRQEITRLAAAGELTSDAQRHYAGPARPREELYDTARDPRQIQNLAASPEHQAVKERLRRRLEEWMARTHDLGFMPEAMMAARWPDATPYERAQDPSAYPRKQLLAAAKLVGGGPAAVREQAGLLQDPDAAVRYWAAVGLNAAGEAAAPAAAALRAALADASPVVRIEAAATLCNVNEANTGLPLLEHELKNDDLRVALHAARALELLGEKARPVLPSMQAIYRRVEKQPGDPAMFMRFALEPAIEALAKGG